MKTKTEIKERISDIKAELVRLRGLTLTSEEIIEYECRKRELATLDWVLDKI